MKDARTRHRLDLAGLKDGFQIREVGRASRSGADLLLLQHLTRVLAPLGPLEGELWDVLLLLLRWEDNVSAAGRALNPGRPDSGRRQVTRMRKKLLAMGREVLGQAARIGRNESPVWDVLRQAIKEARTERSIPFEAREAVFWAFRVALAELGLEFVKVPELESAGWRLIASASRLECPTSKGL